MNASVPSLLHTIKQKLDANLGILSELSHTWPIANMFLEFFQTMVTPDQFNQFLTLAVDNCRKRAHGDEGVNSQSRSTVSFKRPVLKQVMLPQSRVAFQILVRETRKQNSSVHVPSIHQLDDNMYLDFLSDAPHNNTSSMSPLPDEHKWDDCDPSMILENLRRIIRVGELRTQSPSDLVWWCYWIHFLAFYGLWNIFNQPVATIFLTG